VRPTQAQQIHFTLHVLRSLTGGPERYDPRGDAVIVGSSGAIYLPGERFCHPREAALTWEGGKLWLDDLDGGNGVFIRIRSKVELAIGDEFICGDQLLRIEANGEVDDGPGPGPTYYYGSPRWESAFRVVQVFEGGGLGACALARGNILQIGSGLEYANDLILRGDPIVAKYHCVVEEQAETFVLTDLGARSGVFVRIKGRQNLVHDDELLVGRTRLRVDLERRGAPV
jgi:hypothetical protein